MKRWLVINGVRLESRLQYRGLDPPQTSMRDEFLLYHARRKVGQLVAGSEVASFVVYALMTSLLEDEIWWFSTCKHDSCPFHGPACFTCDGHYSVTPKYNLKVDVSDGDDSTYFLLGDDDVQRLLNVPCEELLSAVQHPDDPLIPLTQTRQTIARLVGHGDHTQDYPYSGCSSYASALPRDNFCTTNSDVAEPSSCSSVSCRNNSPTGFGDHNNKNNWQLHWGSVAIAMEDQRRERVTPRRLSFNLDDFSGTPDAERNQGSNKTYEVQPELNLLQNLETPANADGTGVEDTSIVVTASMLNSILAGQQSLVEMVADLSSLVSSKRSNEEAVRMRNTREAADDALVTQRDLKQLMQNKLSPPNTIFDLEPPLSEAVMMIPYPQGYQPPTFRKFDGTGSARAHYELSGQPGSIQEQDRALQCKETFPEADLVYGCIKNIEDGSQIFLSLSGVTTFAELMKKAADIVEAMKKQGKKVKGTEDMFDVCMNEEREKRRAFKSGRSPGKTPPYNNNEVPPIPLNRHQICQLVEEWLKDGTLRVRTTKGPLTREQYDSPEYCILHKANSHNTTDCWTKRKVFHKQVKLGKVLLPEAEQGEELHKRPLPNHSVNTITPSSSTIRVEEIEEERYDEEKVVATGLAKTRGFRMLFGQLGMGEDAQREAAKAIIHIARKWGGHLGAVNAPLTKLAQSHATAIIFREPANLNPQLCHNRPLYVEAIIDGIKIRRALVDNGSGVNIIPTYLFHKLNMPSGRICKSDITLSTFHGEAVESLGRVHAVLEVGPIRTVNVFHVVEGDSSYQLLLGRPWIHLH
ncbi:Nucleic acid-binding, OB-fold [Sesbania bispinosa]|nr:Nucleic acid-binding, OB-fold [Sesbania bispinosa]